jgi:hypothetical protein
MFEVRKLFFLKYLKIVIFLEKDEDSLFSTAINNNNSNLIEI